MKICVFTDGSSFIKKDYYESASAMIITVDGTQVYECGTYHTDGTISKGEVYAMQLAFDKLHEFFDESDLTDVTIISDSEYAVKSVNSWIYNWAKNGWINSKNEQVKFKDIFEYLYETYLKKKIKNKNIHVYHINSHVTKPDSARRQFQAKNDIDISQDEFNMFIMYNNKVDALANAIRTNKTVNYEEGELIWEKRKNHLKTINGKILIKRRKS